ncbi:MAG: hypothetical protein JKY93_01665 [Gammaproteobacteria bacterium]|nr:hypothetical protein [Gammaproteobacteria bacterium]
MGPLTAIALARTLITTTGLGDWFSKKIGDEFGDKTANSVIGIAKVVAGVTTTEDAIKKIEQDQSLANKLQLHLKDNEHELKTLALEDVASARDMYGKKNAMADKVADHVTRFNLLGVVFLILVDVLVLMFVKDSVVAVALGNIVGAIIQSLLQERQQVIGFFFGSSLGSKEKTAMHINLVKDK